MIIKIDKTKEVTGRLPFEPMPEFGNFAIGHLTEVELTESLSKDDAKWEFRGMNVPMLSFRFTAFKRKSSDKDRFMTISFMPIPNTKVDGTDKTDANLQIVYTKMWDKIKHLHDQYLVNDNYAPITTDPEFDNSKSADDRLKEFKAFFKAIVKDFKIGKDKKTPIYKEKQDLAIVLVASGKALTYHAIPDFVGKGIFEIAKFEGGKLSTDLRIPINAVLKLGVSASAATQPGGNMVTDIPDELKALGMT
jgi:hypothetical protein